MVRKISSDLPPGFRFHPTDEELIMYYLRYQATSTPCPVSIIPEIDIYKFDPWELLAKAEFGENEWYFFTPTDRKYPNGVRPNRATVSGYWEATGTDKAIYSASKYVGIKKALVFYKGKPPKGVKTYWIMHEYRLTDHSKSQTPKQSGSMRLDDWVLCKIYQKKNLRKTMEMMKVEEEDVVEAHHQIVDFGAMMSFSDFGTGTVPLLRKTVDDVWREIVEGKKEQRRESIEVTLEDFILNTGIGVRPREQKQAYQMELDENMTQEDFLSKLREALRLERKKDWEDNLSTGLLVPSCSSRRFDSIEDELPWQFDLSLEHPTEATITNRGRVDVDVAHDIEIEKDTSEIMQLESHFGQENIEPDSTGSARSSDKVEHSDIARCGRQLIEGECVNGESNWVSGATTNIQRIDSQKNSTKQRIVKDYGITRKILEEHFGMHREDAAKSLRVSVPTFKRICREYNISRWPHPKTRKVYPHVSQGVSLHGVEPNVGDQHCPNLSQEKGTDNSAHERSIATEKPCDSVTTVKVTYRDDMIKFKLTPSSTRVELEGILEKKLNVSLQRFSIKYQDEDNDWVTITEDADLRECMRELRLLGRTTMKLLLTPKSDT